jgi:hypothetical protein
MGYTGHLLGLAGIEGSELQLQYIVSDHDDVFPDVYLLDLGVEGLIPRGANALRTDIGTFALSVGPFEGGFAVILPFDPQTAYCDVRQANKSFYYTHDRLPSERVSLVAKGELRYLVSSAFRYLHAIRRLPYAHLWYFPQDAQSVFSFRIDSDGASREEVDALYQLSRDHDIAMSWFLDVKSHAPWLQHFGYFVEQEIGLHCYEHQTYSTYTANLKNITKGLHELRQAGMQVSGFTAPFGVWNPELARVLDEVGFEYSSEFSYAYDTLPLYAEGTERFRSLQVPIHPVCVGSMTRIGYGAPHMNEYFSMIVRLKLARNEPLFFYHHPSHRHLEVLSHLFRLVRQPRIENMTMGSFARWWKRRNDLRIVLDSTADTLRVSHSGSSLSPDVWLHISSPNKGDAILPLAPTIDMKTITSWTSPQRPIPPPADIRRAREFDPRKLVGELYSSLLRRMR